MAEVKRVNQAANIEDINRILEADGCIVIENVISKDAVQKIKEDLHPHFHKTSACQGDFYGYQTKRLSGLITKSVTCQDLSVHPIILSVMDQFLLKGCREY